MRLFFDMYNLFIERLCGIIIMSIRGAYEERKDFAIIYRHIFNNEHGNANNEHYRLKH